MILIETLSANRIDFKRDLLCLFPSPLFPNHARKTKPTPKTLRQKKISYDMKEYLKRMSILSAYQCHLCQRVKCHHKSGFNWLSLSLYEASWRTFFLPGCGVAFIHRAPGLLCSSSSSKHQSEGLFFVCHKNYSATTQLYLFKIKAKTCHKFVSSCRVPSCLRCKLLRSVRADVIMNVWIPAAKLPSQASAYLWSEVSVICCFMLIQIKAADWHAFKLMVSKLWISAISSLTPGCTDSIRYVWGATWTDLDSSVCFDLQQVGMW